ncbi:hypothetical protein [Pseudomonas sp. efr-133-TYG-5]|uniref:hypothetical protein n=1 Tax=Pseudomonas sp. efr-133-TYG-5 TaxID=3040310 RepID=UPI002557B197|nr:hypothetical protein [Pseudomonas sp. efr-133-TYG-5]
MADLLQTTYERNHLRNYNAWLNELDDASPAELAWQTDEAWRHLQTATSPDSREHCHALFDPFDNGGKSARQLMADSILSFFREQ